MQIWDSYEMIKDEEHPWKGTYTQTTPTCGMWTVQCHTRAIMTGLSEPNSRSLPRFNYHFNHLPSPLVNWVHMVRKEPIWNISFLGLGSIIVLLFQLGGHKWDPKHMDLFLRYICWNRFCKLLQSRVTGLCLALAVWLRSGGRGPHTRGRVSSYPQLVGDSSRMQHVAFLQSFLCPNQNVNYICLSVAVSTGERPSLFGVGACRKSVTTLSIITPPSRHTPDLYVLLGARGVRIAITPTFYRARCTLGINLTTQWV